MQMILEMKEIEQAIADYLVKQGLRPELSSTVRSVLFLKKDGSINYEVDKAEVYVNTL